MQGLFESFQEIYFVRYIIRGNFGSDTYLEAVGVIDSRLSTVSVWFGPSLSTKDTSGEILALRTFDHNENPKMDLENQKIEISPGNLLSRQKSYDSGVLEGNYDFQAGIILYLRDRRVVGALLFNLPEKLPMALQVLDQAKEANDLKDIKSIFGFS